MKTLIGTWMLMVPAVLAWAQENDDLYFRSKDRQKPANITTDSYVSNYDNFKRQHFPEDYAQESKINPTDSYSARQVNPEYISRANAEQASEDEQNYFIQGYNAPSTSPSGYYGNSSWNNSWNTNNWYAPGWYGPSRFNNWYSPYYGFYDPWMNPFWGNTPGWNYGFSNYWAPWGSGWNIMIGYSWGNTWCNNFWGPSWSYWNYPHYYYGGSERTRINYGKRPSGNVVVAGDVRDRYSNNRGNQVSNNTSGRTRGNDEYYVRPSRRTTTGSESSSNETLNRSRSYSRDTYNSTPQRNNTYRDSRPAYTPSRSGSFNSGGTPNRAPSSGSRSRGRD
ncbi:MAG: hypothetical protein ACK4RF_11595 [Cyclobacteriaceae bacterium]